MATYDYRQADGRLLYQVVRRSDKSFRQRRPNGHGGWIWNVQGIPRVLYNLPQVTSAPSQDWVFTQDDDSDPRNGLLRLVEEAKVFMPADITRYEPDGPDPLPIPADLPPVQRFNPTWLPSTLRPWVVDIAERMQCPPDFPAVASMVALSGVLGRKIAIRPKQRDNWTVYANLWGMLIGRPSLMKSPPMKEALLPIRRMTAETLAEYEEQVREHTGQRRVVWYQDETH